MAGCLPRRRMRIGVERLVIGSLRPLYDYAWFVGFIASAAVYVALRPSDAAVLAPPIDRAAAELARR